jgi:bifunctional enzyme CysN/CysC
MIYFSGHPGHEQYTRNGHRRTADAAIVLIDAGRANSDQAPRFIAALLGVLRLLVAINKMDLVDYPRKLSIALLPI